MPRINQHDLLLYDASAEYLQGWTRWFEDALVQEQKGTMFLAARARHPSFSTMPAFRNGAVTMRSVAAPTLFWVGALTATRASTTGRGPNQSRIKAVYTLVPCQGVVPIEATVAARQQEALSDAPVFCQKA